MSSLTGAMTKAPVLRRGDLDVEDVRSLRNSSFTAWDIETSGLDPLESSIGTVQVADENGRGWLVQVEAGVHPQGLIALLSDASVRKVFHFAPFDLGFMRVHWGARAQNVACTKVLDKLVNPNVKSHSLKDVLARELSVDLPKPPEIRRSDWTSHALATEQIQYAMADVFHLVPLYDVLMEKATRRGVSRLAEESFTYLPTRVETDLLSLGDLFAY